MDNQETVAPKPSRKLQQSGKHPSLARGMLGIRWPFSNIKISNSALTESPIAEPDNALRVDNSAPPFEGGLTTPSLHPRIERFKGCGAEFPSPAAARGWGRVGGTGDDPRPAGSPPPALKSPAWVLPHPLDTTAANRNPKAP